MSLPSAETPSEIELERRAALPVWLSALPAWLLAVLGLIALTAIAVPLWIVTTQPRVVQQKPAKVVFSKRVVPKTELPPVDPVVLQPVTPTDAVSINASIPLSKGPNPAARP